MWPALKKDDIVFIKNVEKDELKVGDIIVYENSDSANNQTPIFTIHRIVKLNKSTIKTRGDANNIADPLVKYENVIGRALTIGDKPLRIPHLGKITSLASNLR
ncbi:MAG: signal peptidase I, partial [Candidatus Pacebacteria bacterium]|nr:signal peptidase I [Candidatus Paceibacterota bacterium]